MRRNLGLIMALVVVFFAIIVTVHLSQEDEAQAINVFAKTSESGSGSPGFDKIWSFNRAEADKWTRKADMPTARGGLSASMVNGKIYVIGGTRIPARPDLLDVSVVEEYDPMTDKWIKKTKMPAGRETLSTSVVNGKIYAVGGSERFGEPVSTVEEYDPETNTWSKKADMPIPRQWLATSAVDGKIYAIGGFSQVGALSTVEEYDTGFVPPQRVEAKGKLPISWGKVKSNK